MKRLGVCCMMFLVAACVAGLSGSASADNDPPSRIARLSYLSGDVSMQPGGVDQWVKADLNRPLTRADRLWTAAQARAEMHIGSTAIRMAGETSLTFTNLDDSTVQLQLAQGTLELNVRQIFENETYEVDTPNGSFTVSRPGEYRFDVDSQGDVSTALVRSGELNAWQGSQSVTLGAGRLGTFSGENFAYNVGSAPGEDDFDRWCATRNRREDNAVAARYVSPYMTGYEDLDGYGRWITVATYGPMWVPAVSPGWAPYRFGHWVWIEPWGWTWVDDAPWGFAPFHYGRWVYYSGYWGWCPGPRILRPVYAPALVAWIGGRNWGIGVGFGYASWVPLGWGEVYAPWYHAGPRYWRDVNRTTVINNVTIINNVYNYYHGAPGARRVDLRYANYRVRGAVTAVPKSALAGSQPIDRVALRLPERDLGRPDVLRAPPVAPTRETVTGGRGPAMRPPARVLDRQVMARTPAPQRPVPFREQERALQEQPGRPLTPATLEKLRQQNPQPAVQASRMAPMEKPMRRGVPMPPQAQGGQAAVTNAERVPMPRDNGVVRHEVPRPPEAGSIAAGMRNTETPRSLRAVDDGQGRPAGMVRHQVPRPPEAGNMGRNAEYAPVQRHEVPQPEPAGRVVNSPGPRYEQAPQSPQYDRAPQAPRYEQAPQSPRYENAPQAPRYESPRYAPPPQSYRSNEGARAPQSQPAYRQQAPQREYRPAAREQRSAPRRSAPAAKRDGGDKGRGR